ncbi:MAG: hypothetical protein MK102_10825 [Fuerstiella sp.]|nr:hypothetical protein [Fuerstiella sp.]
MIRNISVVIAVALFCSGCHVASWTHQSAPPADPPLPMDVSCDDLIDHLNQQSGNLKAWQCTDVRLTARFPGVLHVPTMKGNIACEYPNRFHLTATSLVASADMGANSEHCWFQSSPGHHGVISWRHEDSRLLQELPSQVRVPYIDPDWLMLVLGVKQLDANDYVLERASDPHGKELWLSSVRKSNGHNAHRYVIKVDREKRVVREHVAFDRNGAAIVRALLSNHQDFNGHLLPRRVRLILPGSNTELTLSFSRINTNPSIDTALWVVPSVPNGENLTLREMAARIRVADGQQASTNRRAPGSISLLPPEFQPDHRAAQTAWTQPVFTVDGTPAEPDWSDSADASPFTEAGNRKPHHRKFLGMFPLPRLFGR